MKLVVTSVARTSLFDDEPNVEATLLDIPRIDGTHLVDWLAVTDYLGKVFVPQRDLTGSDLFEQPWSEWPRHPGARHCPNCDTNLNTTGLTKIAYVFDSCTCPVIPYKHLIEQAWHRECLARSEPVMGLALKETPDGLVGVNDNIAVVEHTSGMLECTRLNDGLRFFVEPERAGLWARLLPYAEPHDEGPQS